MLGKLLLKDHEQRCVIEMMTEKQLDQPWIAAGGQRLRLGEPTPLVWGLISGGLLLLAAFVWYELRVSRNPVLDLRIFTNGEFSRGALVASLVAMVVFGSIFMLPIFFQQIRQPNASATEAGLILLPQGIASLIAVVLSGRLFYNRLGPRILILTGAGLLALGSWGLIGLTETTNGLSIAPWLGRL